MEAIKIHDKTFTLSIGAEEIERAVQRLAGEIVRDFSGKDIVFVVILNGAFMFASDLIKHISLPCSISFVKLASYEGSRSTRKVKQLIGLNEVLRHKTVIVVEDIIDSGTTMDIILQQLTGFDAAVVKIATLLFKPDVYEYDYSVDYVGFRVPPKFLVGYGLDYNGLGRNLPGIYAEIT
jgi:hypoxanthine phosphoribosyltransferase